MRTHATSIPAPGTAAATLEHDRRRRQRVASVTVGYLMPEVAATAQPATDEPWEVRIHDVSRLGVGFVSAIAMKPGDTCRIRIGIGPMRLARRMRVVNCTPEPGNHFRIGAEFA